VNHAATIYPSNIVGYAVVAPTGATTLSTAPTTPYPSGSYYGGGVGYKALPPAQATNMVATAGASILAQERKPTISLTGLTPSLGVKGKQTAVAGVNDAEQDRARPYLEAKRNLEELQQLRQIS